MKYDNLVLIGSLQCEDIISTHEKSFIVDDVFTILQEAYKNVKGGLHFSSKDELIAMTKLWKVIYFEESVVGVVIYKAKKGLKMVALGISTLLTQKMQTHIKTMLSTMFKRTFKHSWMEVSESAERFICKSGGESFFIKNTLAREFVNKEILSLCGDGYHYTREINGVIKNKVMIGTVRF